MEEDWIRQLEEGGIDLEAQGRELERRKQEHSDRLVAEAIQRDLSLKGEEGGERGENAIERVRREVELFSQSQSDAEIARVLQEAEQSGREGREGEEDALLVQRLQREENDKLQQEFDEQLAIALQNEHKEADTSRDEEMARVLSAEFESTADASTTASTSSQLLASQPNWWSPCPTNSSCKYHLIEISRGSSEWEQVTTPFRDAGFTPQRLQRVQNIQLYQRLQFEKQTMQMDREDGYQVNERLLFHTTAAAVSVICSEGLDQRLSRRGRFGSGVYFSDNPRKCDAYWKGSAGTKTMFACHVLLGKIMEYPSKKTDPSLRREPPGYDSVKGNITGQDEYIIYANYRAMPAYVVEYQ